MFQTPITALRYDPEAAPRFSPSLRVVVDGMNLTLGQDPGTVIRLILPSPVERGRALFDLTRLWRARGQRFGTGVDRIDLAFGLALLDRLGKDCGFVMESSLGSLRPSHAFGARLLRALDLRWRGEAVAVPGPAALAAATLGGGKKNDDLAEAVYVNASHSGLPRRSGALARLDPEGVMARFIYVHDLIPLDFPEYQRPETRKRFIRFLKEGLAPRGRARPSVRVGANSGDTARRVAAYAAAQGWSLADVETITPCFTSAPAPAAEAKAALRPEVRSILSDGPFFLALGTIEPRKNHLLLLTLWRTMAAQAKSRPPRLVIAGRRGWENEMVLDMLERCPAVRAHVSEFGNLRNTEVQVLLSAARALLAPSFAEGLGLPLLEAGLRGTPVIASDLPAHREIAPAGTVFLDPLDGPGWACAIRERLNARQARRAGTDATLQPRDVHRRQCVGGAVPVGE